MEDASASSPLHPKTLARDTVDFYDNTSSFYLTNCLSAAVSSTDTYSGSSNQTTNTVSGIFQTAAGGYHYLAANSPYRNTGTTNINSALLAALKTKTTFPPVEPSQPLDLDTTFSPQAQLDTDLPDLGYHYNPLDYFISSPGPEVQLRFTDLCMINTHYLSGHLGAPYSAAFTVNLRDCHFAGVDIDTFDGPGLLMNVNNCLFERVAWNIKGPTSLPSTTRSLAGRS